MNRRDRPEGRADRDDGTPKGPETSASLTRRFSRQCRRAGLADTPQRRVIYEVLAASIDHPTAEAVYERVKKRLPRLSLATVYRNLKLFVDAGLIEELATEHSFARFDANPSKHHHLICTACNRVSDYYSDKFDALVDGDAVAGGFEVKDVKVSVYGMCPACQKTSTRAAAGHADAHQPLERKATCLN